MKKNLGLVFFSVVSLGIIGSVPNAEAHGCPDQIPQKCNSATNPNPLEQSCYQLHQWPTCGCIAQAVKNTPAEIICGYDSSVAQSEQENPPPPMQTLPNNPYTQGGLPATPAPAPTQPQPIQRPPSTPRPFDPNVNLQAFHTKKNMAHLIKVGFNPNQTNKNNYAYMYAALVQAGYSPRRVDLEHRRLSPLEFNIWAQNRINYRLEQQQVKAHHDLVMDNAPLSPNGL